MAIHTSPARMLAFLILIASVLLVSSPALAQSYGIRTYAVTGGADSAAGGIYAVSGIIGQPGIGDAMQGGAFAIRVGFDAVTTTAPVVAYTPFTDEVLTTGVTVVKRVHILELRQRIDAARTFYGLAAYPWTDPVLSSGTSVVRAVHIIELRTALQQAFTNAGPQPTFADAALGPGQLITRAHIMELRTALAAIEQR